MTKLGTPTHRIVNYSISYAAARGNFDIVDYLCKSSGDHIGSGNLADVIDYNSKKLSKQDSDAWKRVQGTLERGAPVNQIVFDKAITTGNVELVEYLWSQNRKQATSNDIHYDDVGYKEKFNSEDLENAVTSGNKDMVEYVYKNSEEGVQMNNKVISTAVKSNDIDHVKYVVELYEYLNNTALPKEMRN